MVVDFSDYPAVHDDRGGCSVFVPASVFDGGPPPRSIPVVDLGGRSVVYEGGGRCYYVDSAADTRDFYGWSYWESEATEDVDAPCVNLLVVPAGFDPADYRG